MRKLTLIFALAVLLTTTSFAGGLVTNTNQSAAWVRLLIRDASTGIDAVYYNPAGLGYISNGFHLSLNNQFITQKKDVTSSLVTLNDGFYRGEVSAPLFPGVYAVYKMNKLAFSFGFNPIGGGGGAEYNRGLPSFENDISGLVPGLAGLSGLGFNISGYDADIFFEGTSVYFGAQLGVTYTISDMISVFAGARYVFANNTYNGYLQSIMLTVNSAEEPAVEWLTGTAVPTVNAAASSANSAASLANTGETNLQAAIDGGVYVGSDPLTDATFITLLTGLGHPNPGSLTNTEAVTAFATFEATYTATAAQLTATSGTLTATAAQLEDKEVDATQGGSGFAPILGVHFRPSEKFDLAVKYEFKTAMTLTNETAVDGTGMFPDGEEVASDMPAMLSVGANFRPTGNLTASAGFHYYFDKSADYGRTYQTVPVSNEEIIDKNYWEAGIGLEYMFSDRFGLSIGYLRAQTGVNEKYQSDLTYSLTSNTIGGGIVFGLNDKIAFNLGVGYAMYETQTLDYTHSLLGTYNLEYYKDALFIGLGVDFSF